MRNIEENRHLTHFDLSLDENTTNGDENRYEMHVGYNRPSKQSGRDLLIWGLVIWGPA